MPRMIVHELCLTHAQAGDFEAGRFCEKSAKDGVSSEGC